MELISRADFLALEYYRGSGRPRTEAVPRDTYVSARWRAFDVAVGSFFLRDQLGAHAVAQDFDRFCEGSGFGSSRPDVSVK